MQELLNQALATNLYKLTTRAHRLYRILKTDHRKKTQGTKEKRKTSHPGNSNSSHPGPALKGATLEMVKKDEEKKKKEEKDNLKKQQKEERKQQWQKEQAQKEKEQTEKVKQAAFHNPYSVFAEKDEKEVMDDDSVVFIEPSSSDHLPKGTLSRLPLTKIMEGFNLTIIFLPLF